MSVSNWKSLPNSLPGKHITTDCLYAYKQRAKERKNKYNNMSYKWPDTDREAKQESIAIKQTTIRRSSRVYWHNRPPFPYLIVTSASLRVCLSVCQNQWANHVTPLCVYILRVCVYTNRCRTSIAPVCIVASRLRMLLCILPEGGVGREGRGGREGK